MSNITQSAELVRDRFHADPTHIGTCNDLMHLKKILRGACMEPV